MSAVSALFAGVSDSSYRESIEFSANFNRRLSSERRMRMPFLDPQTGVAQAHSSLFMDRRQRMPGFREGQVYSYPAARWRKSRRQYLTKALRPFGSVGTANQMGGAKGSTIGALVANRSPAGGSHQGAATAKRSAGASGNEASNTSLGDATDSNDMPSSFLDNQDTLSMGATSDSKDSQSQLAAGAKEDLPKEWFYDDMDMHEIDALEEPKSPADDEFDYDPRYGHKKKKRRPAAAPKRSSTGGGAGGHLGGHSKGGNRGGSSGGGGGASTATGGGTPKGRGGAARRKSSKKAAANAAIPVSPTSIVEPPSFEMAAAAVQGAVHPSLGGVDDVLGGYRKYL